MARQADYRRGFHSTQHVRSIIAILPTTARKARGAPHPRLRAEGAALILLRPGLPDPASPAVVGAGTPRGGRASGRDWGAGQRGRVFCVVQYFWMKERGKEAGSGTGRKKIRKVGGVRSRECAMGRLRKATQARQRRGVRILKTISARMKIIIVGSCLAVRSAHGLGFRSHATPPPPQRRDFS